jgi:hypothetical protein
MPPREKETPGKLPAINPMIVALGLGIAGWLGVAYLFSSVHPTLPAKGAFLAVWAFALMGTAWPVLLALHRRFRGEPTPWTVWRQSAWVGAFGAAAAWLQMNRLLNIAWAVVVAGVFVVIEIILSLRARQEARNDD